MDSNQSHPPSRGGFRGRPYRGFDMRGRRFFFSGRGRGMGRGGPMGGRGMPPMMRGRGMMRGPRGMGLGMRGMGPPRTPRGMGRPQGPSGPPGAENDDPAPRCLTTVSFAGSSTTTTPTASAEDGAPITTTTPAVPSPRGAPRGRGGFMRGRGGYGGPGMSNNTTIPGTGPDPKPYRGGFDKPRGYMGRGRGFRGGFNAPPRPVMQNNGTGAPVPSLKRNGMGGLPGPKRGRYDSGPPTRGFAPKPSYAANPSHMNHQYSQPQAAPNHHSGYAAHDGSQQGMDPYAQSYQAAPQQSYTNNGYTQTGYTDPNAQSTGYTQTSGYDQTYQDYNSSTYGTQDSRYSYGSTQDYQSGYGASTDYSATTQDPYTQSSYDDRAYSTSYDANAYSQGSYSNHTTGYY